MQLVFTAGEQKSSENAKVFLLLTVGFFIGIFIATLNVSASTLFLDKFDEQTYLPKAIIVSGLIGVVITYLFARFESRARFATLCVVFLLGMLLTISSLRVGLLYFADSEWIIFVAFTCINPFTSLAFLIFWGIFGRIFNLRESKRIIGRIDSGQLIASILALFTIPIVLTFLPHTSDLLWISSASIGCMISSILVISRRYDINRKNMQDLQTAGHSLYILTFFKNPYIFIMAVFVNIAMIAIFFVDYSFLAVTAEQFPDPRHLANFISIFSGTVVILSFLFQNFVTDRIINMYGLKISLLINPVLLTLFTLFAAVLGSAFGYNRQSELFILFFLAISLGKLFAASLKDALDSPTFKLYFLPLDASVRFSIQTRIEGVVTVFSGLMAGSILLFINSFHIFELIHFTYFLIPVIIGWVYMIHRMYGRYRHTLEQTLSTVKSEKAVEPQSTHQVESRLMAEFNPGKTPEQVIFLLDLVERLEPELLPEICVQASQHPSVEVRNHITRRMEQQTAGLNIPLGNRITPAGNGTSRGKLPAPNQPEPELAALQKLARSKSAADREMCANRLADVLNDRNTYILLELLRDSNIRVRRTAIQTARKVRKAATWPILTELLASPVHAHAAATALVDSGEAVLPVLEQAFHKTGQQVPVLLRIVHIYSRIGGDKAIELLWNKIEYPDKGVVAHVLSALKYCRAVAIAQKATIINRLLETEIGTAAWNQAALLEIADESWNAYLKQALEEEMKANFDRIFTLLSLLYDAQSIQLVRENIESQVSENTVYALELLDVFIDKNLKQMLFPLLDDIPPAEEVSIYQTYFPRERLDSAEVLHHIINRDFNQLNRWTKACAMFSIMVTPGIGISHDLVAHLFNPDHLLRETAAWAISSKDNPAYQHLSTRLPAQVRNDLERVISPVASRVPNARLHLIFEKVLFLRQVKLFAGLPGNILVSLAESMELLTRQPGQVLIGQNENHWSDVFLVAGGKISWQKGAETISQVNRHGVLGDLLSSYLPDVQSLTAVVAADALVYRIDKQRFYQSMNKHPELVQQFLQQMNQPFAEEMPAEPAV